jgi:hypothetical protein
MTEISFDETADVYFGSCGAAAGSARVPIVGSKRVTGTVTFEPSKTDVTLVNLVEVGDTGALTCYPAGNTLTHLKISAAAIHITGRQMRISSSGVPTVVANFATDGLTIAAATGS